MPDDEDAKIDSGFMTISSSEVAKMFKPITDDVLRLIKGQIESLNTKGKTSAGVILVGGLGKSLRPYKFLLAKLTA